MNGKGKGKWVKGKEIELFSLPFFVPLPLCLFIPYKNNKPLTLKEKNCNFIGSEYRYK